MIINDARRVAAMSTSESGTEFHSSRDYRNVATHDSYIAWCDRSAPCVAIASELFLNRKGDTSYRKHCSVLYPPSNLSHNSTCAVATKLRGKLKEKLFNMQPSLIKQSRF